MELQEAYDKLEKEKKLLDRLQQQADNCIGKKYILWQADFGRYTDQMGVSHTGYIVDREVEVTVVEASVVPGTYGYSDYNIAQIAGDKNGNIFSSGWGMGWTGDLSGRWWDADIAVNANFGPFVRDNQKAIPPGYTKCEKHNYWHHKDGDCRECRIDAMKGKSK